MCQQFLLKKKKKIKTEKDFTETVKVLRIYGIYTSYTLCICIQKLVVPSVVKYKNSKCTVCVYLDIKLSSV